VEIQENVSLAPLTTLKIGGPARYLVRAEDETDLWEAAHFARDAGLPIFVLGGGSNLVVSDGGFPGVVLYAALQPSVVRTDLPEEVIFDVSAGTDWDAFVFSVCEQGLSGLECLAGIPGLVGGAPVQNIGAYGQEVAETIVSVRALDLDPLNGFIPYKSLTREECGFSYRKSIFNSIHRDRYVATTVRFQLSKAATPNLSYADLAPLRDTDPTPLDVYRFVRSVRERKGMVIDPNNIGPDSRSAGSFFKNPVVVKGAVKRIMETLPPDVSMPQWPTPTGDVKLAAAWLIEQAGFPKGFVLGRVGISSKHTLALINRSGDARCADLLRLRDLIQATVEDRFGIHLEQEPVMLG
jgi:UDP-N-acetylmuramate dehydrogenase